MADEDICTSIDRNLLSVRVRYNLKFGEPVPCGDLIYRLVKKLELTGSVGNRNKGNRWAKEDDKNPGDGPASGGLGHRGPEHPLRPDR